MGLYLSLFWRSLNDLLERLKGKFHPYNMSWRLDGGGQRHAPAALPLSNKQPPILQEDGWAQGLVWTGADNLATTGIRSPERPARSESSNKIQL